MKTPMQDRMLFPSDWCLCILLCAWSILQFKRKLDKGKYLQKQGTWVQHLVILHLMSHHCPDGEPVPKGVTGHSEAAQCEFRPA